MTTGWPCPAAHHGMAPGAMDWLLDAVGLRAGDTFTITAATARVVEAPEPSGMLLAMMALPGMTAA